MARALLAESQFGFALVSEFGVSPSTVFGVLKKWEKAGVIERCEAPARYAFVRNDAVWYEPTPQGRRILQHSLDEWSERFRVTAALDPICRQ